MAAGAPKDNTNNGSFLQSGLIVHAGRENARYLALVLVSYLAVYGGLLLRTGGLPYVLDNNESFSSLWHAANLFNYGIGNGYGLADEAFAFHASAHPYVHTHQGNFPRLFAYLIYLFGARSIEAQIIVTTFTVGLAATVLAYRFFAVVVTPFFGLLACFILMTDYMLVAQWQVVTYRVWYEFFIFSSAWCAHAFATRTRWWYAYTFVNFACLFYFELVFVAFVTLGTVLYAAILVRDVRRVYGFVICLALGAFVGIGILLTQLLLYVGWEDLKRDAYLTFVARNRYLSDATLLQEMKDFFSSRNIVFWYNLEEGARYRTPGYFISSFTRYEFELHTPLLTSITAILVSGFFAGLLRPGTWAGRQYLAAALAITGGHLVHKISRAEIGLLQIVAAAAALVVVIIWAWIDAAPFLRSRASNDPHKARRLRAWSAFGLLLVVMPSIIGHVSLTNEPAAKYSNVFAAYVVVYAAALAWVAWALIPRYDTESRSYRFVKHVILIGSAMSLLAVTLVGDWAFGIETIASEISPALILFLTVVLIAVLWVVSRRLGGQHRVNFWAFDNAGGDNENWRSWVAFGAFALFACIGLYISWVFYDQSSTFLWEDLLAWSAPGHTRYLLVYMAVPVGALLATSNVRSLLAESELRGMKRLSIFLGCALAAYGVVYMLSPGYIFSGYRFRFAPLTVYHTNTLLALAAFILVVLARKGGSSLAPQARETGTVVVRWCAIVLLALMAWYWLAMQARYVQLMPPDNYQFLKRLREPPYEGKSFIVSNYAAPIAASTGQWAYLHSGLSNNRLAEKNGRLAVEPDNTYLWFADRNSNAAYARPDYFICAIPPIVWSMHEMLRVKAGRKRTPFGCAENVLVQLASHRPNNGVSPALRLVEVDRDGPARVGFERWAIVQLLWDERD